MAVKQQRGITLIGFVLVLMVIAIFAVVAMNLVPVYNEAFSVRSAMKNLAKEPGAANMDIVPLQKLLQRKFDIDYVSSVKAKDAKIVHDASGTALNMNYEVRKHLVYNLDFVAMFDYTVPLNAKAPAGE
jgi:Tfp pilus assembly major pilin PilA